MLVRICRIVSSRSSTVARIRSVAVPGPSVAAVLCRRQPGGEQPLDHVVVQVGRDAVALVEHDDPLLLGPRLGQLDRQRGLVGEARGHVELLRPRTPAARRRRRPTAPRGPASSRAAAPRAPGRGPDRVPPRTAAPRSEIDSSAAGIPVRKTCPDNEPVIGTSPRAVARPRSRRRPSTRSSPSPAGSTTVTRSARAVRTLASAMSCSGPLALSGRPPGLCRVIAATACSHSPRACADS